MTENRTEAELDSCNAVEYFLIRMCSHQALSHHMIGTECYQRMILAYAKSKGKPDALKEPASMLDPERVLLAVED